MKSLSSFIMAFVIIAGFILVVTPFIANKLFPIPENTVRLAKPDAAAMALKRWFKSPNAPFIDVQAINKSTAENNIAWFTFSVGRRPVEKYILDKKLIQKSLTKEIMNNVFFSNDPPASWWEPKAINQKTYFTGEDQGRFVSLIYNPNSKRGVLVTQAAH